MSSAVSILLPLPHADICYPKQQDHYNPLLSVLASMVLLKKLRELPLIFAGISGPLSQFPH